MRLYLDASVIVPVFVSQPDSGRSFAILADASREVVVSRWAAAEVASTLSRLVRMGDLSLTEAHVALDGFDSWSSRMVSRMELETVDLVECENFLRQLDLGLTTPDMLHVAIAKRLEAALATFDIRMARAARRLGLAVVDGTLQA